MLDIEKQKLLLTYALSNTDLFARCNHIMRAEYFDVSLKPAVKFAVAYFEKYKALPTEAQIAAETSVPIKKIEMSRAESNYAADEIAEFCRHSAIFEVGLRIPELMEKGDIGSIERDMKSAIKIGLFKDTGVEYFANPEQRLNEDIEYSNLVSTGWSKVDDVLGGGISRQELLQFMANTGVGKSILMLNVTRNLLMQRLNGVYITLELAERVVSRRIDCMISGVEYRNILKNIPLVVSKIAEVAPNMGRLFVKRMPESATTARDIRSYLTEVEMLHGVRPDFIVVDYLDLMMTSQKIQLDNLFIKDKFVAEEVRAIGAEYDCIIISASQMKPGALEADSITTGHIQGGSSKANTADNLVAIIQTEQMRAGGEYMLEFAKTRNSGGVGQKVILNWDPITLRVSNMPEGKMTSFKAKRTTMNIAGTTFDTPVEPSLHNLLQNQ